MELYSDFLESGESLGNVSYNTAGIDEFIEVLSSGVAVKIEYEDITFCQLVIIENILNNGVSPESIPLILSTYYRPIDELVFDNDNNDKEDALRDSFTNLPTGVVLELYRRLMDKRNKFINGTYKGVIYSSKSSDSSVESVETIETKFNQIFFWYERQRSIAKELNMKMSDVLLMKANDALFELAYQSSRAKVDDFRRKQQEIVRK